MSNGPSKEDLELYWQNSRQYFDELAKYYQQSDPEYYRKFMKPYYDNPFRSSGSSNSATGKSGAKVMVIAVMVFLLIAGAGSVFFFLSFSTGSVEKKIDEKINEMVSSPDEKTDGDKTIQKKTGEKKTGVEKTDEPVKEEEPNSLSDEDNYIIGAKYIAEKNYDKAVFHLKQIPPGSKRYKEAQQLIESVKYLKKYNK